MTPAQFWQRLTSMRTWRRRQERAPHKPLLLLLALGHFQQGSPRLRLYKDIEVELHQLLIRFGPPRKVQRPDQPFQRLPSDGLWEIRGLLPFHCDASGQLRPRLVRESAVMGGLPEEIHEFLIAHPWEFRQAVQYLLSSHFPASLHMELLEAVNLGDFLLSEGPREENQLWHTRVRNPRFRPDVIRAYGRRCAICGYDVHLQDQLMGLEAAHIRWHAHGGPDEVANGLALCAIHHRAFDRGGIGLGDDRALLVSSVLQGQSEAWDFWFQRFAGQPIHTPQQDHLQPHADYLRWHRRQVFRGVE